VDLILGGCDFTVSALRWAAPAKGHDRHLLRDGFVAVADGATALVPGGRDPGEFAADALRSLWVAGANSSASGTQVWRQAIDSVRGLAGPEGATVSCSVVAVRERGTLLEFGRLGDCSVLVTLMNGEVLRLYDTRIATLDRRAARSVFRRRRLVHNRRLMNTPAGYWIFADVPEAAHHTEFLTVEADQVDAFAMFSDGLSHTNVSRVDALDDMTVVVAQRTHSGP
jgi:hypothetical protein